MGLKSPTTCILYIARIAMAVKSLPGSDKMKIFRSEQLKDTADINTK